jgi:AcrR family transcriptional regulator
MADHTGETQQRLLDAAEILFADKGFDAVSVRDIAGAAGVNVAAVNYHFGGKERLYRTVLTRLIRAKRDRYQAALRVALVTAPDASERGSGVDPVETVLRSFFHTHFEDSLKSERGAAFIKLLAREIHHGDAARMQPITELLAPMWTEFQHALVAALPGLDDVTCAWVIGSLHGQLIHFTIRWHTIHAAAGHRGDQPTTFLQALFPPLADDVDQYIDRAVTHIARFSAAGIRALAAGAAAVGSTPPRKDEL